MDLSDPPGAASTSTLSNRENEKIASTMIESTRARFFKTYQRQSFSLPDSIMFYIAKNPASSKLHEKMIQTCKYFFLKNPILVVSSLNYRGEEWCVKQKMFDLDNSTCKLWITSGFHVGFNNKAIDQTVVSFITPKIFKCNAKNLTFVDQILSFADLSLLCSNAEWIYLTNITVKENDGSIVGIKKIVEVSVKAKDIEIFEPPITSVTSKTMKELIDIPRFCKLIRFSMNHIPETFDLEAFYVYMKKCQHTRFSLDFDDSISETYKNRLEEVIDEIIATDGFIYKPPYIYYPGMSREKSDKLYSICCNK